MATDTGLELGRGDQPVAAATVDDVNAALGGIGAKVWALDLSAWCPGEPGELLARPTLTPEECGQLRDHCLLPREKLLELITEGRGGPQVPGGGALTTTDITHGVTYPRFDVAEACMDYSRFDQWHVNRAPDGTCVDEVIQVLSGGPLVLKHRLEDGETFVVKLTCPGEGRGWLLTHSGGHPHIGSFSEAAPGTKVLGQVIGPAEWEMVYV